MEYLVPSTLGIGLVKAYDTVGLENSLTKPHLRRLVSRRPEPVFKFSIDDVPFRRRKSVSCMCAMVRGTRTT